MKKIHCIEILEQDPDIDNPIVIERYPFDLIPHEEGYVSILRLKEMISEIEDRHTRCATENRMFFILNRWYPKNFVRVGTMNWKYSEEYYKNLTPSHSKGFNHDDE